MDKLKAYQNHYREDMNKLNQLINFESQLKVQNTINKHYKEYKVKEDRLSYIRVVFENALKNHHFLSSERKEIVINYLGLNILNNNETLRIITISPEYFYQSLDNNESLYNYNEQSNNTLDNEYGFNQSSNEEKQGISKYNNKSNNKNKKKEDGLNLKSNKNKSLEAIETGSVAKIKNVHYFETKIYSMNKKVKSTNFQFFCSGILFSFLVIALSIVNIILVDNSTRITDKHERLTREISSISYTFLNIYNNINKIYIKNKVVEISNDNLKLNKTSIMERYGYSAGIILEMISDSDNPNIVSLFHFFKGVSQSYMVLKDSFILKMIDNDIATIVINRNNVFNIFSDLSENALYKSFLTGYNYLLSSIDYLYYSDKLDDSYSNSTEYTNAKNIKYQNNDIDLLTNLTFLDSINEIIQELTKVIFVYKNNQTISLSSLNIIYNSIQKQIKISDSLRSRLNTLFLDIYLQIVFNFYIALFGIGIVFSILLYLVWKERFKSKYYKQFKVLQSFEKIKMYEIDSIFDTLNKFETNNLNLFKELEEFKREKINVDVDSLNIKDGNKIKEDKSNIHNELDNNGISSMNLFKPKDMTHHESNRLGNNYINNDNSDNEPKLNQNNNTNFISNTDGKDKDESKFLLSSNQRKTNTNLHTKFLYTKTISFSMFSNSLLIICLINGCVLIGTLVIMYFTKKYNTDKTNISQKISKNRILNQAIVTVEIAMYQSIKLLENYNDTWEANILLLNETENLNIEFSQIVQEKQDFFSSISRDLFDKNLCRSFFNNTLNEFIAKQQQINADIDESYAYNITFTSYSAADDMYNLNLTEYNICSIPIVSNILYNGFKSVMNYYFENCFIENNEFYVKISSNEISHESTDFFNLDNRIILIKRMEFVFKETFLLNEIIREYIGFIFNIIWNDFDYSTKLKENYMSKVNLSFVIIANIIAMCVTFYKVLGIRNNFERMELLSNKLISEIPTQVLISNEYLISELKGVLEKKN